MKMLKSPRNARKDVVSASLTTSRGEREGAVRIVGGRWRRTPLAVVDRNGLRPTPERVRETVFDWLGHLLGSFSGKSALDLFAGSGALGFEALSRGMKAADFVERDSRQAALLKHAAAKLSEKEANGTQIRVHQGDAFQFLEGAASYYDVIFIDPPYALNLQDEAIVEAAKCLGPNGILYVERSGVLTSPEVLDQQKLVRLRSMSAGQVTCELLGFAAGSLAALAKVKKPLRGKAAKIAAKQAQKAAQG